MNRPMGCRTARASPAMGTQARSIPAAAAKRGSAGAPPAGSSAPLEAWDAERRRLDAKARSDMRRKAALDMAAPPGSKEGAWKWEMRKAMWDFMEANDIARFPRPVHHRIPNFVDADKAAQLLATLPEYQNAKVVKVNPDTPQKPIRAAVLGSGRTLLTPQPRLRTGFFSVLTLDALPGPDAIPEACTAPGVAKFGRPLGLQDTSGVKVDLLVVGSSCVSANGARLGKGEGFAELEYGIMRLLGVVDENTPVVTTVHDCQVLEGDGAVPADKMLEHDVPVDIIVTPTRVIRCQHPPGSKKPPGILWHKLSPEKLASIRVLQQLKEQIERERGVKLPSGPSETLPPLARRGPAPRGKKGQ